MYETLGYEVADGVAVIRLNRPQAHNAVNSVMDRELPLVWQRFMNDKTAIVAIVTGAGEKAFCTGADLADLPGGGGSEGHPQICWGPHQNKVWKPVICAVNGMAVGGGLHFIAEADIVIAASNATFFDTHVRVGLVAGLEPIALLKRMPMEAVLRMALTGGHEKITAQRALALGLISEYIAPEALQARATEIAGMIKKNSPAAMARTKKAIWQSLELPYGAALENAWKLIMENNEGADFQEGAKAFLEKRPPRWAPFMKADTE